MSRRVAGVILALSLLAPPAGALDLLPDLIVDGDEMSLNYFDTDTQPGRTLLRFQSSLPNVGAGPLILEAVATQSTLDREAVEQEIRNAEQTAPRQRPVPGFAYNTDIWEMEVLDWVAYRIREVLPGDGVGEVLRSG